MKINKKQLKFPCRCGRSRESIIHCKIDVPYLLKGQYFPCERIYGEIGHCWIPSNLKYLEKKYKDKNAKSC